MNSPDDIAQKLAKQWYNTKIRVERLLTANYWPLRVPIGKPSAKEFTENPQQVQQHVQAWRQVNIGNIQWQPISYRASLAPIAMPIYWELNKPTEWIAAASNKQVMQEYQQLEYIIERVAKVFHPLLIRQCSLWRHKLLDDVITAARLATQLTPGCAQGLPLRLLSGQEVDTKFFEKNRLLLTRLLDEQYAGEVSEQGFATFLDALDENNHWLLLVPLSTEILPFKKCKVTTTEFKTLRLPCSHIVVIENEQCIHQLPELPNTLAILGAGLDLSWLASPHFNNKTISYWGDMDSWGLLMLARARKYQPSITALLMSRNLFDKYASVSAVVEPVKAQDLPPEGLSYEEVELYRYLLSQQNGRLEQEFLPKCEVEYALQAWVSL